MQDCTRHMGHSPNISSAEALACTLPFAYVQRYHGKHISRTCIIHEGHCRQHSTATQQMALVTVQHNISPKITKAAHCNSRHRSCSPCTWIRYIRFGVLGEIQHTGCHLIVQARQVRERASDLAELLTSRVSRRQWGW